MKVFLTVLSALLISMSSPLAAEGRFAIVGTNLAGWVWVLDTESGKVRTCTVGASEETPVCSPWTQE